MPKHPIYVLFLPRDAQEAIGKPHENSRHALQLLEDEGFRYENYIDIFDAGPTVECRREDIRAVRTSQRRQARLGAVDAGGTRCLVSNTRARNFRCCLSAVLLDGSGRAVVDRETAEALRISDGEPVRVLEL